MPNSHLLGATHQLAGACGCSRSLQLRSQGAFVLRAHDATSPGISAPRQAAERQHERQHASAPTSTGLEISTRHSSSESSSYRHGAQLSSSQSSTWQVEQAKDRSVRKPGHEREAAQAGLWCWEWENTRWRASFYFLMASVAFVVGSGASLQPSMFAGSKFLASLCLEWPFALGSLSYLTGARLYKRAALEGYALQRRTQGRLSPVLKWARVEVLGTGMVVFGCELGSVSSCAPLLLQAFPASISRAPLSVLEAWLSTALNTVAGALFVVGSYTILAGMYHSFAPQRVLSGPHVRTLNFWGSAAYLVGSCGLLTGAIFAQPLFAVHPVIRFWVGQFIGYLIGSLWFVTGAFAQIGDVARELQTCNDRL